MAGRMYATSGAARRIRIIAQTRCSVTNYEVVVMTSPRTRTPALGSSRAFRAALVAVLGVAAVLHLWLTPAHFEESTLMGVGFAAAAAVEFGLALAVLLRPMRLVYVAIVAVAIALIGAVRLRRGNRAPVRRC